MRRKPERTNDKKKRITLLGVIANGSTSDARKLLQKYDLEDAKNHEDLEYKLTRLYYETPDKITIEKELAEIHPHREFINKYTSPAPIIVEKQETETKECSCNGSCNECAEKQQKSNACGSKSSNACGSCSSFEGNSNTTGLPQATDTMNSALVLASNNTGLVMLSIFGLITIFVLAKYKV